jgi:hypothetical protein
MAVSVREDRKWLRAAFGVALAVLVSAGSFAVKAHAADANNNDDDDEDTVDTKFMKNILRGVGLSDGTEPGIDYHERSPLVVPPTNTLPLPESKDKDAAVLNPAWPKDPDKITKKKVKRVKRNTTEEEEESMRQLMPNELSPASKAARARADGPPAANESAGVRDEQLLPSQLGHEGFTFGTLFGSRNGTAVKFTKEPERANLTDPPVGLRTPSPKYSYGTKGKLEADKNTGNDQAVFGVDK